MEIDFEGNATPQQGNDPNLNNDDTTPLNGGNDNPDITGKDGNEDHNDNPDNGGGNNNDSNNDNPSTGELEPGSTIEFDGANYTVAENGDIVDSEGKVFKAAAEVKDWLAGLDVDDSDTDNSLSVQSIQQALGIEITGEDGKPVEFTDDADGVKSYVNSVIELKSNEIQQAAINKFYNDNPLLKQFQDYVTVTGTAKGFGELPDRTGWTLNKDNEGQLESIIRMAAAEFGNKALNDNYIKYLKDSGALYDTAKEQLEALQAKDKEVRAEIQRRAEAARQKEEKELNDYWNEVNRVVNSRTIAGYKLPETFIKEVNGQKITLTPNDFYEYLAKENVTDEQGNKMSAYRRDLINESQEDLLNRELLSAWLMFTGGSYKDLVDMAIKEEQVKRLKVTSRQNHTTRTIKIQKPKGKADINDIVL